MGRKSQQPLGDEDMSALPVQPPVEDIPAPTQETQDEPETPIVDILNPLHEAGGVVFGPLFTADGKFVCNATARALTGAEALEAYMGLIDYAANRFGLTPFQSIQPAPVSQPAQPHQATPVTQAAPSFPSQPTAPQPRPSRALPTFNGPDQPQAVISVSKLESRNNPGVFFLKVKTQGFPDGVMAFSDVIPQEWAFQTWAKFKEYGLPEGWTKAVVGADKKGNAIVKGFAP